MLVPGTIHPDTAALIYFEVISGDIFKIVVGALWAIALVAVLLVAVLGGLGYAELESADGRIAELQSRKADLDAEAKRVEPDAKRLAAVDEFAAREVVWLDELYDLADRIPDVAKVSVTMVSGDPPMTVPKAALRPGQVAPDPKTVKPSPAAKLVVNLRSTDDKMVQRAYDGFAADKFYADSTKKTLGEAGGKGQAFELQTNVLHRAATDYLRRLSVTFPKPPAAPADDELPGGN